MIHSSLLATMALLLMGWGIGCSASTDEGTSENAGAAGVQASEPEMGGSGPGGGAAGAREAGSPDADRVAETGASGRDATTGQDAGPSGPVVPAFWDAPSMTDESVLFVQEVGKETATARLLFVPEKSIHPCRERNASLHARPRSAVDARYTRSHPHQAVDDSFQDRSRDASAEGLATVHCGLHRRKDRSVLF